MFIYQPPERERKIKTTEGKPPSRRVVQTIQHVSKGWLPVNPTLLKEVQEKLQDGEYRRKPQNLVEDVKRDPGLFMHAVRHLSQVSDEIRTNIDPIKELSCLEEEKLKKIFCVPERQISEHRFRDITKTQALRLEQSVISTHAAEALAAKTEISRDLAFSGTMLRQLGHDLIAWNYPEIYARALSAQRNKGAEIDLELVKFLGIAPLQVGSKFAADWNLSADLRMIVTPRRSFSAPGAAATGHGEDEAARLSLAQVCEAGEQFARANDPAHYPKAAAQWAATEEKILKITGGDPFADLYGKVVNSLSQADAFLAKPLEPLYFERPAARDDTPPFVKDLLRHNIYVQRCPRDLQETLVQVYHRVCESQISVEALRLLVNSAIPAAGFVQGCLYLLDRKTMTLIPALRIGDIPLSRYKAIPTSENHPVVEALYSTVPLRVEGQGVMGREMHLLCGSIGAKNKPGVLYLEIEPAADEKSGEGSFITFQALRACLADCLGEHSLPSLATK